MSDNPVTRMFLWWNKAYADHAFSPEGFARYFTEDAPFIVDGGMRGTGPAEINAHFQRIRANTDRVELHAVATLADEETCFIRYRTEFRAGDESGTEECVAFARLRDGRIAMIDIFQRV